MTPLLQQQCSAALHVVCPDGTLLRAGYGVLYVLRALGWWWVAPLMWPPMRWGVDAAYGVVARNRRLFARFIFRSE